MRCARAIVLLLVAGTSMAAEPKDATTATRQANQRVREQLPFADRQSFDEAHRGFIAPLSKEVIRTEAGDAVWDPNKYAFIEEGKDAPDTVNPSLWRQSQLVNISGLFKVVDRIYQVRNGDLSNMTIIEGVSGIIVVDPLISAETARAALELYFQHRPKRNVVAVIYSHSHIDHFGGVRGVVSGDDVQAGKVQVYAPEGFFEHAISENVMAGNVMGRRANYMYGNLLPPEPRGQVGAGLGMTTSTGTVTLIPPTVYIRRDGQEETIDALKFQFLLAPGSEAPAEMHWYLPELKALTVAENACHTQHNLYSLRGTKLRDPLAWSKYLHKSVRQWGGEAEVLYGMHHWPVWGTERVVEHLEKQRDMYRFINDQTLRLANQGLTMTEIAETVELPEPLAKYWSNRDYYGTLNHNVKSTYVFYLGWFEGNPATLHRLPPVEASKKYVAYMGGAEAVLSKAREAFKEGDYRWVAEVVNHVVFAEPENIAAKELQADTLEQLGYQAESGPWRNFYLTGAKELRDGIKRGANAAATVGDVVEALTLDQFFDYLGIRLNAPKAAGKKITLNFDFTDTKERYVLKLADSVLNHWDGDQAADADATLSLERSTLNKIMLRQLTMPEALGDGSVKITGKVASVGQLFGLLDTFDAWFPIVTP
ncbi:MAG TPA: alkyl sulfatase dimerization domain-containing protein [Pirellulales bacterium]|nr:alkyl sulfatase dimerization domain-containing protein [Pirellulales bacterium]